MKALLLVLFCVILPLEAQTLPAPPAEATVVFRGQTLFALKARLAAYTPQDRARAITEGGWQSVPKVSFPGGALIGCSAGFVNVPRIKGSHNAMKTGMLAAEAAYAAVTGGRQHDELTAYPEAFEKSWLFEELDASRNTKQWMKKGLYLSSIMNGIELWLLPKLGFKAPPWTVHNRVPDHAKLAECKELGRQVARAIKAKVAEAEA